MSEEIQNNKMKKERKKAQFDLHLQGSTRQYHLAEVCPKQGKTKVEKIRRRAFVPLRNSIALTQVQQNHS
jgi:hypothetical protein